jgi:hypothetical protein
MADTKRQVGKLHLTGSPKIVPDFLVLFRKAQGLRCTDENTPFLTAWCDSVMRIVRTQHCAEPENHKYWHLTKADIAYWSKYETPFEVFSDIEHARGIVAEQFGITVAELVDYERRVSDAKTLQDLYFTDVIRIPGKVALKAVVAGEVQHPVQTRDVQAEILKAQDLKLSLCRYARRGEKCPYDHCKFVHTIAKVETVEKPKPKTKNKVVKPPVKAQVKTPPHTGKQRLQTPSKNVVPVSKQQLKVNNPRMDVAATKTTLNERFKTLASTKTSDNKSQQVQQSTLTTVDTSTSAN